MPEEALKNSNFKLPFCFLFDQSYDSYCLNEPIPREKIIPPRFFVAPIRIDTDIASQNQKVQNSHLKFLLFRVFLEDLFSCLTNYLE
jgi:hypothetical protein